MKKILLGTILFGLAASAYAFDTNSWYVEPHLGLVVGDFDQEYEAAGTHTVTGHTFSTSGSAFGAVAGFSYGAKLGYHWDNFFLAGDVRMDHTTYHMLTYTSSGATDDFPAIGASVGATFGYRFDFGLGLWLGLSGESVQIQGNDDTDMYSGSGVKYGIGYKWTNWALNFEYAVKTYTEVDGNKLPHTQTIDGITITSDKLVTSDLLISVSRYFSF